jgi:hypothetical protein
LNYEIFRKSGGPIFIPLSSGNRRDIRVGFTRLGGNFCGNIYDSDYSAKRQLPSVQDIPPLIGALPADQVIVALGSNLVSIENELAAMLIRSPDDWDWFLKNLYPKVVTTANVYAIKACVKRDDLEK